VLTGRPQPPGSIPALPGADEMLSLKFRASVSFIKMQQLMVGAVDMMVNCPLGQRIPSSTTMRRVMLQLNAMHAQETAAPMASCTSTSLAFNGKKAFGKPWLVVWLHCWKDGAAFSTVVGTVVSQRPCGC